MNTDAKHINKFIRSAINQRQRLLQNRGNRKNAVQAAKDIKFLNDHLNANKYSPRQLASFYCRHYDKIAYLLPPNRQKNAEILKDNIINPKLF